MTFSSGNVLKVNTIDSLASGTTLSIGTSTNNLFIGKSVGGSTYVYGYFNANGIGLTSGNTATIYYTAANINIGSSSTTGYTFGGSSICTVSIPSYW